MIKRLYVHNYRCLVNFELNLADSGTDLVVGRNGVGKTSLIESVELLGSLALGRSSFKEGLAESLFSRFSPDRDSATRTPTLRFEIEAVIRAGHACRYMIAFEWPKSFETPRILDEGLWVDGVVVFSRTRAETSFKPDSEKAAVTFPLDWHQSAVSQIQEPHDQHPLHWFKTWLSNILILKPIASRFSGVSRQTSRLLKPDCSNFADWYRWILLSDSEAGSSIGMSLREVWPEFRAIRSEQIGPDAYDVSIEFSDADSALRVRLEELSDGEKMLVLWASVICWSVLNPDSVCLWDEPDAYVSLYESQAFVRSLRNTVGRNGQFIATSHSPEAMRAFSRENTIVLRRKSHTLPTQPPRFAIDLDFAGDDDIPEILARGEEGYEDAEQGSAPSPDLA